MARQGIWKEQEGDSLVAILNNTTRWARVAGPMVRYSKLPFRLLVRQWDVDICYTPMIMADSFIQSPIARTFEFSTDLHGVDRPLVVQFGARNAFELGTAAELISPFVDGIDLNCGCPQKWALQEGIGAALLEKGSDWVHLVDMIRQARERSGGKPVSVKIRILDNDRETVDMAQKLVKAGVSWITVHGRTKMQRSTEPVNYQLIRTIKESVECPVIVNGNVFSLEEATRIQQETNANGVMAARGLLENPAMFAGYSATPWSCVDEYVRLSIAYGTPTTIFHHHLTTMSASLLPPAYHHMLNALGTTSVPALCEFIKMAKLEVVK